MLLVLPFQIGMLAAAFAQLCTLISSQRRGHVTAILKQANKRVCPVKDHMTAPNHSSVTSRRRSFCVENVRASRTAVFVVSETTSTVPRCGRINQFTSQYSAMPVQR